MLLLRLSVTILGNLAIYCKRPEALEMKDSSQIASKYRYINDILTCISSYLRQIYQVNSVAQWNRLIKISAHVGAASIKKTASP